MANNINPLAGAENFPAILTKQEAADFLRCTTRYVERVTRQGRLRAYRPTGKLWRVRLSDLEEFLESTGADLKTWTVDSVSHREAYREYVGLAVLVC